MGSAKVNFKKISALRAEKWGQPLVGADARPKSDPQVKKKPASAPNFFMYVTTDGRGEGWGGGAGLHCQLWGVGMAWQGGG